MKVYVFVSIFHCAVGRKKKKKKKKKKRRNGGSLKNSGFFSLQLLVFYSLPESFFSLPLRLSLSLAPPQQHSPTWLPPSYPWLLPPFLLFLSRLLLSAHWFKSRAKPGGELVDAEPRLPAHHSPTLPPRPPRRLARK